MKRLVYFLCLIPTIASAQEIILNPQKAQFTPSPDHTIIVRYELRHFIVGQTTPVSTVNLGKPAPDVTNTITAFFPALLQDPTKQYIARVVAIGSEGEGISEPSNGYLFAEGVQMIVSQKVKLTITCYDDLGNPLPPAASTFVWAIEGATPTDPLGSFQSDPEPSAIWFLPIKSGVFRIQGSFAIAGIPFIAWTTVVVNP